MAARMALRAKADVAIDAASDLEALVGYNLKRAYVLVQEDFRRTLGEAGPSARVFAALSLTVQSPGITQSELARNLGIERSALVAIVDDLEARGFLQRTTVPSDRRVQALMPTPRGNAAYAEAKRAVEAHEERILAPLSHEERMTLVRLLRKLRSAHDEDAA